MTGSNKAYKYATDIVNAKFGYDSAQTDEERQAYGNIANNARKALVDMGFVDLANDLGANNANAETAQKITNSFGKTGRTMLRSALVDSAKKWGMTEEQANNLISYDDDSGEVSFGSVKVGAPDTIVEGRSYVDDPNKAASAVAEYVERTGFQDPNFVNNQNQQMAKNAWKLYNYLMETSPFMTDEGKAILDRYDLKAMSAKDNALAENASANDGNIDSFAAANALRQQAALRSMGEEAALAAHQQKIDSAVKILESLGARVDTAYNQGEESKINEANVTNVNAQTENIKGSTANDAKLTDASVAKSNAETEEIYSNNTGFLTGNQIRKAYNTLWNEDGMVKELNIPGGYKTIINDLDARWRVEEDPVIKENLYNALGILEMARNDLIVQTGSSEAPTFDYHQNIPTAPLKMTESEQQAAFDLISHETNEAIRKDAGLRENEINIQNSGYAGRAVPISSSGASSGGTTSGVVYNVNSNNPSNPSTPSSEPSAEVSEEKTKQIANDINKKANGKKAVAKNSKGEYKLTNGQYQELAASTILRSTTLTDEEKAAMLDMYEIPTGVIVTVRNDSERYN